MDSMLPQHMRPKLSPDTYYIPWQDGVYLRNNNYHVLLKGKSLYALLKRLAPLLDGTVTLEQLTAGLETDKKSMLVRLLEKLLVHHLLQDSSQEQSSTRSADEYAYASDITFIASFQTIAEQRFASFRCQRLLIIGSEPACIALMHASLHCGIRRMAVIIISEGQDQADSWQRAYDRLESGDVVQRLAAPRWDDEAAVAHMLQAYDVILHIAESPFAESSSFIRARLLNRLCIEHRKTCLQAIPLANHMWVGPLVCPESDGCWECAWLHLQAQSLQEREYQKQEDKACNHPYTLPAVAIAANHMLFALFASITQAIVSPLKDSLLAIDLHTLQNQSHTFFSHPHCQACQHPVALTAVEFIEKIQQLQIAQPIKPAIFVEAITSGAGERAGQHLGKFIDIEISERDFAQVPLAVYEVNFLCSGYDNVASEPLHSIAASIDPIVARQRALQKACERYAITVVDQRRLLSHEAMHLSTEYVIFPRQIEAVKLSAMDGEQWAWALDLHTQQPCLIPAMYTFANCQDELRGVASGMSWDEALCRALCDWFNYLAIAQMQTARRPYFLIDLAQFPLTPRAIHLYHLLETAIGHVSVYAITGSLPVPTFAICADARTISYGTHCDSMQALERGFELALQQYQSALFQQPAYGLAAVPDLPVALRSDQRVVPRSFLPDAWPERLKWLLRAVADHYGWHACVVPLDHDPSLARIFPYIVRVLLFRTEAVHG